METSERIVALAVSNVNEVLPEEQAISSNSGTIIFGPGAQLDSMGYINFLVALEDAIETETGRRIDVAEQMEDIVGNGSATLGQVSAFLSRLLGDPEN